MSAAEGGWGWGHGEQLGLKRVKGIWVEVVLATTDTQQAKGMSNSAPWGGGHASCPRGRARSVMAALATRSGGSSPMQLLMNVPGLLTGMHHGKTKVCQWTLFPPPCLDCRWVLHGADALLLRQML